MLNNPILKRESRTRWRGARAFLLMMAYAATLAIATVWRYGNALPGFEYSLATTEGAQRAASLGRELFLSLSTLQMIGWLILAPALTATGLAGERERGLLEGVQLSRLSPVQILWGKMLSALSFIVLMIPVALPITATCFLLGGMAPHELIIMTLLQLVTAINGASIGLFFSARSRRAQAALASAFMFTAAWGVGSYMAFEQWQGGAWVLGPTTEFLGWLWALVTAILGWSSPLAATNAVINPLTQNLIARLPFSDVLTYVPLWSVNIALQLLATAIFLWLGTRSLRRPMADLTISDRRWTDPVRERYAELMAASAARAANARERASSRLARKAGNALLWELPLHKLIRFRNPILQREVRGKFRWRSGSLATTVFQALLGLVPAGLYVTLLFAVFYPPERASTWWGVTGIGLTVFMLACAVMGASSITREREGGTWEGLHLSLLPPREIIAAKFAAPLIACFYYSLPILPVLAFYINYNFAPESNRAYGVPVLQAIATVFVVVGASAACTAWGLFLSSLCTRTLTAVSWTLATLLLTLVLVPMLSSGIAYRPDAVMRWWQPYIALNEVRGNASSNEVGYQVFSLMVGARFLVCMAVASLWLLTAASVVLRRQMRNVGLARDVATPSPTEAPQATG